MKTNKTSLIFLLLLAMTGTAMAQQWRELHTGVTEDLFDVCCIDTNTVFVCGQNGVILKTSNGGTTWEEKYRRTGCQITKISFANPLVGYAFCDSLIHDYSHAWFLLKTDDGGNIWQNAGPPRYSDFHFESLILKNRYVCTEMSLKCNDTIFVAISYDGLYRSVNGGISFEETTTEGFVPSDVRGFYLDQNIGYLLWGRRSNAIAGIAKTEDGGETWCRIDTISDLAANILFAHFQNANTIRVWGEFLCDPSFILDTQDGFETFEPNYGGFGAYYTVPYRESYQKCRFTDQQHGIAFFVGKDMTNKWDIAFTNNNGASWTKYSHPYSSFYDDRLYGIDGIDTVFYISGEKGLVVKNQRFSLTSTDEQPPFSVSVYPNPMVDKLYIKCKEESIVAILSINGQVLFKKNIVSEAIDTSILKPGLYLICITDNQGRNVFKRVLKNK